MTDLVATLLGVVLVNHFVLGRFPALWRPPAPATPARLRAGVALLPVIGLVLAAAPAWLLQERVLPPAGAEALGFTAAAVMIVLALWTVVALAGALRLRGAAALRPFLPLACFNGVALGAATGTLGPATSGWAAAATAAATGTLFAALLWTFGELRERLEAGDVPAAMRGAAIALVTAAIISLAFAGLEGAWRG